MATARKKAASWGATGEIRSAVAVGMGGNLGDVVDSLRGALEILRDRSSQGRVSSLYRTAPIGPPQPPFLNAVALIEWPDSLDELLALLMAVEERFGRIRSERWGPRSLDLDILWSNDRVSQTASLSVPHPRLLERRFALEPLLELVPDASHPENGAAFAESLTSLERQGVELVSAEPW